MRRAAKVDANQEAIVDALRAAGYSVTSLAAVGNGCPDLLCGVNGRNVLLEVKMPGEKLNSTQKPWHRDWKGKAHVIWSADDALFVMRNYGAMG